MESYLKLRDWILLLMAALALLADLPERAATANKPSPPNLTTEAVPAQHASPPDNLDRTRVIARR